MTVPYLFMPAKDPAEVVAFFDDIVQAGELKVINAEERPDVWDRVEPCDDIRLIVGTAETHPPEGVDIAQVLSEFRPEPDARTQFANWAAKPESDMASSTDEPPTEATQDPTPAVAQVPSEPPLVDQTPTEQEHSAMDRPWTSFASRGFKG